MPLDTLYHMLDPVAIQLGPIAIRWYGLAYLAGFVLGGLMAWRVIRRWDLDITSDELFNVVVGIALGVIIGARAGYVIFYGAGYYLAHPLEILALSQGGMSFHGGLVGAIVGGSIACRLQHMSIPTMCDIGMIVAPIGLFFGRVANFINGELWGKPTNLPWGVMFETGGDVYRHPSQLYEALLEGVVLFVVLWSMSRRLPPRPQGTFLGTFLVGYGVFRFLVEFVRVPDAQLGYLFGGVITMGQMLSAPLVLAGVVVLLLAHRLKRPQRGHVA